MTVDLAPYLAAVPASVVDRLRGARRVLAVSHENPDADTLGATLGVVRLVEALGGAADAVCTDPVPPLYGFLAGIERFGTDPDTTAPYDLLVISDCGSLERIGEVAARHAELFERLPRVIIDHHASNDAAGEADWIDPSAAATCEMVTLLAVRLGVGLDAGGGALAAALMAGIVMDTATFAHPNATPRTLVLLDDETPAARCGGEGRIVSTPCANCRGDGRVREQRTIKVEGIKPEPGRPAPVGGDENESVTATLEDVDRRLR